MKPLSAPTAYLLISHGSRDVRPAQAMNLMRSMVAERLSRLKRADIDAQESTYICGESSSDDAFSGRRVRRGANSYRSSSSYHHGAEQAVDKGASSQSDAAVSLLTRNVVSEDVVSEPSDHSVDVNQACGESILVGTACLELARHPLHQQIYQFGLRLMAVGVRELKLVPIFLMAGTHVTKDIPSEVAIAQSLLGDALDLTVCDHLGAHPEMPAVLAKRLASLTTEGSLLVAHGSRRQKGNRAIQHLAQKIDTPVAYWAVPPDIESQVIELMQQGCQGITILPYFLFAGGITDAIAHRTEELAERFPKVTFRLLPTLGATEEIADLVVDLL